MLDSTHYQRNASQNHNEVPPHMGQNDHHQKIYEPLSAGKGVEKREASYTVGGKAKYFLLLKSVICLLLSL